MDGEGGDRFFILKDVSLMGRWSTGSKRALSKSWVITLFTILNPAGSNQVSTHKGMAKEIVIPSNVQKEAGKIPILTY